MQGFHRVEQWEKKIWGKVAHLQISDHCLISYLHVEKGHYCSKHVHHYRTNTFIVMSGVLRIILYKGFELEEERSSIISPGVIHFVAAGEWHRFDVLESGDVIEVYHPGYEGATVDLSDIEREYPGGILL